MKLLILLAGVIACSLVVPGQATDVEFYFYSQSNPSGHLVSVSEFSSSDVLQGNFNPLVETAVLYHGYNDDDTADSNFAIKSALLNLYDINVIVVNWGALASGLYNTAKGNVPTAGAITANLLQSLNLVYDYPYNYVTLIGFSLGAHVAGATGANLNGLVRLIIGLDAAGPGYSASNTKESLDPTDALYVTAFHTNYLLSGILAPVGHSDYYLNGGAVQPGCGTLLVNSCSHSRAFVYFVESLTSDGFVAQRCSSYIQYTTNLCTGPYSVMGGFYVDESACGTYYLNTNSTPPYALG